MTSTKTITFAPTIEEIPCNDEPKRPITRARRFSENAINSYRVNRKSFFVRASTLGAVEEDPINADTNGSGNGIGFENFTFDRSEEENAETNGHSKSSVLVSGKEDVGVNKTETAVRFDDVKLATRKECTSPDKVNDEEWLKWAEAQFGGIAKGKEGIDKKSFMHALRVKESFFADRFFDIFDKDGSGSIDPAELMDGLYLLTKGTTADRLNFLFDVYDQDGSGYIDIEELRTVLLSCTVESSITLGEEELDLLTETLFTNITGNKNRDISFEEFQDEIQKHPIVLENLTLGAAQWLRPPCEKRVCSGRHRYLTTRYAQNNLRKIIFIVLYFIVNLVCFIIGCWNYRSSNGFIVAARGAGLVLNFNSMFIIVLMLRNCITWLRTTPVHAILPLDQHIMMHKLVGMVILLVSVWHSAAHVGNAAMVSANYNLTMLEFIFTTKADIGWISGLAPITGVMLVVIVVVICVCSMPFVRRSGHFQIFYWTHLLYVPLWILLVIHCRNFWLWFIAPGLLFLIEKISRSKFMKNMRYGETYITEVNLMPSGVTHLVISKPAKMTYQPGDYIFLQIPALAAHEWHPFTISSAPELEDVFWVHIRSAGHWTNMLYEYFSKYKPPRKRWEESCNNVCKTDTQIMMNGRRKSQVDFTASCRRKGPRKFRSRKSSYGRKSDPHMEVYIQVFVDGPYGTSSRELFETEHAVLVASGIGVTPYASVLQSIMYRFLESKRVCPRCEFSWCSELPPTIMKLKKVDFIWINRDQKSFEWFVSLLTQLEIEQRQTGVLENILDMHLYMTSALNCTDMKGIGLQMALDLIHQEKQIDLITGLRTRTKPGRPNWKEVFSKMCKEDKGKIKVFFCGSPVLAKTIKAHCEDFGLSFCKENF